RAARRSAPSASPSASRSPARTRGWAKRPSSDARIRPGRDGIAGASASTMVRARPIEDPWQKHPATPWFPGRAQAPTRLDSGLYAGHRPFVKQAAEIVFKFDLQSRGAVAFGDELEVSLDCSHCRRTNRTVIFKVGDATARCCPGSGKRKGETHPPYPGRIVDRRVERGADGFAVTA